MKLFGRIFFFAVALNAVFLTAAEIPRGHVPAEFKWNLSPIFPDWLAWENALNELDAEGKSFGELRGTAIHGTRELLSACERYDDIGKLQQRTFRYVQLQLDVATADTGLQKKMQRVRDILNKTCEETDWFQRELSTVPHDLLQRWIKDTPTLQPYRSFLLDFDGQRVVALQSDAKLADAIKAADKAVAEYIQMSCTDTPLVRGGQWDRPVAADAAGYTSIITSDPRQADRAHAAQAFFGGLKSKQDDYAALYRKVLERDWALAQAQGFKSSFACAVQPTGVPVAQIEAFLSEVRKNTAPLRRYEELRKRIMKVENYHRYDSLLPLWSGSKKFSYEQSKRFIMEATEPLGLEYNRKLNDLFRPGWMDLIPCDGKRAGAYAASVYRVGSFLLLNNYNDIRSVFSLAHEVGHGVHANLAFENQPFCVSEPPVFIAEIASTLNEQLMYAYLSERFPDGEARCMLLDYRARSIIATFYAQAIWADFELRSHQLVEHGLPITADSLNNLYAVVLRDYYGDVFAHDDFANIEWAGVPHFFAAPFYVYQYATSFAISADLGRRIRVRGGKSQSTITGYLSLLKSGGNDRAVELLKMDDLAALPNLARAQADELDAIVTTLGRAAAD